MRAFKSVNLLSLAALALSLAPFAAIAGTSRGTIERFYPATNSVQLTNGRVYRLPTSTHGLSAGDNVTISWNRVGADDVADRVVVRPRSGGRD